ncbi:purine and uridine phosphorylase [Aspergillus tetrazonus]
MPVKSREDFHIAIICALPLEFDAVEALLDEYYDETIKRLGQRGDANWYRTGRLGEHDVVLTCLPDMGQGSASSAASSLLISFGRISLALVVGICGAVPTLPQKREIILGDVIISDSIVEYGLGKQYPDGFKPTVKVKDTIGRPNREIRSFISGLKTRSMRRRLQEELSKNLAQLQGDSETDWKYPGAVHDVLFEPHYRHKHYIHTQATACLCVRCQSRSDPVCDKALEGDCSTVGCAGPRIERQRLASHSGPKPLVHFGAMASADTVMKSGEHRDALAQMGKVIGFEMEGAGVWDNLTCLVIKGVSDYADSHKSKFWQNYAAATAASCVKAFLAFYDKGNDDKVRPLILRGTRYSQEKLA